jgi:KDO2-lipid IV(A) lauroyltransferase
MKLQYRIEAFFLSLAFTAFRILPLDVASFLGGIIGCAVGPFFSAHKTAKKNIAAAFPDLTPRKINRLVDEMWEHLGRIGAEYASLPGTRLAARVAVEGVENLPKKNEQALFFSGHIGNWELLSPVAFDRGVDLSIVYRHTNNPIVDKMIEALRTPHSAERIAKGVRGGIKIIGALRRGGTVAMLIDQKQNNGIPVPFFGRDAMTSPAIAEIALKYNVPLIPARIIRTKGANFRSIIYPPLQFEKTGDHKADVLMLMTKMNAVIEGWIRECPEQWFWVHRRWPKEEVKP